MGGAPSSPHCPSSPMEQRQLDVILVSHSRQLLLRHAANIVSMPTYQLQRYMNCVSCHHWHEKLESSPPVLCLLNLAACLSSKDKASKSKMCKATSPKALPGLRTGPRQLRGGRRPCQSRSSQSCTPACRQSGHSTTCWTADSPWKPRCCAGHPVSQTEGPPARSLSHHTLAAIHKHCCLHKLLCL